MTHAKPPHADGLYDPRFEHDACGVAMVARLDNEPCHEVVVRALEALDNLEHRGAEGADVRTGDGAGILTQLPDALLPRRRRVRAARGRAATGSACASCRDDATHREQIEQLRRAQRPRRGPDRPRLARRPDRRGARRRQRERLPPAHPPGADRGRARPTRTTRTPSSASSTSSAASSSSRPGRTSTRRASPRAPACTRGCSSPTSCAASTPTCATSASRAAWRWCTRASRRTRSRAGSSPIPTA